MARKPRIRLLGKNWRRGGQRRGVKYRRLGQAGRAGAGERYPANSLKGTGL